jgi:hypothetical protein
MGRETLESKKFLDRRQGLPLQPKYPWITDTTTVVYDTWVKVFRDKFFDLTLKHPERKQELLNLQKEIQEHYYKVTKPFNKTVYNPRLQGSVAIPLSKRENTVFQRLVEDLLEDMQSRVDKLLRQEPNSPS